MLPSISRSLSLIVFVVASGALGCATGSNGGPGEGGGTDGAIGGNRASGAGGDTPGSVGSGGATFGTSSSTTVTSSSVGVGGATSSSTGASSSSSAASSSSVSSSSSASSSSSGTGGATSGATCDTAAVVTDTLTLSGQFDDDPAVGGSCDTTPNNAVWFRFTAPAAGDYRIQVANATTTNAYSRLAVFDGGGCGPLGTQLACQTNSGKTDTAVVTLADAQTVVILFHTDGNTYSMIDPQIDVAPVVHGPGDDCGQAVDVSTSTFPHQVTGIFDGDPAVGGSCDTTPTNGVWFEYTATTTGMLQFDLVNHTTTNAYSRVAVFDGAACNPLGAELACNTSSAKTGSAIVSAQQGHTYLVLFHTDGDSYTMVDPEITVAPPPGGALCDTAVDVTGGPFPVQLTGTFDFDPPVGGTCDTTPTNAVWFSFTPPSTATYTVSLANATTTIAYSRLAIFTGSTCSPLGAQVACVTASARTVQTMAALTAGQPYLIAFYTDGDAYTMVNPSITITP